MVNISWKLACIFILGLGLILLGLSKYTMEGFQAGMPGIRCGIDLPLCQPTLQCMNGFCASSQQPALLANQIPTYP